MSDSDTPCPMTIRPRLVEEMVQTPPKGMESWRMYRIEYGEGLPEGTIWLPKMQDTKYFEINLCQMAEDQEDYDEVDEGE